MARNIFISYKYYDTQVRDLNKKQLGFKNGNFELVPRNTRVRDYVDYLQSHLREENHINLGEKDGESLAEFSNTTIRTSLKAKIRQSSITLVLLSKGMVDHAKAERDQWVPWELSYSLRSTTVENRKSHRNAVLGIVLPDEMDSYEWYYSENHECNSVTHNTHKLFSILRNNMFNLKNPSLRECRGSVIHEGEFSYIKTVKWMDFILQSEVYIELAIQIRDQAGLYDISVNLPQQL